MSVCRKLPDGTIQKIAGHTILLDANASEVRQGRWRLQSTAVEWVQQDITFTDPMPDADYVVIIENDNQSWMVQPGPYRITNKTTTGFTLASYNMAAGVFDIQGTYTAFKPVKIEGYTALQNKVNNPDNTPTIDSMNLVTSDGVARAIENASAVWKGTKAEWNALPATTKIKYDLAVLIDTQLIKSVDRTDGTDSDVADLTNVWTGTQAQWDAMTQAQRDQYDKALIQDGVYGIAATLPVGCVQAYMGAVEPAGWLICNGQTFDTAKYPDLYAVLNSNKVPDLRGEFLRGAGSNPITGYAGANVGVHQEATTVPNSVWYRDSATNAHIGCAVPTTAGTGNSPSNSDKTTMGGVWANAATAAPSGNVALNHAVRPTNTSVNWIIFAGPEQ